MNRSMSPDEIEAVRAELADGLSRTPWASTDQQLSRAIQAITQMQKHIAMLADSYGKERALRLDAESEVGEDDVEDKDARIAELEAELAAATENDDA